MAEDNDVKTLSEIFPLTNKDILTRVLFDSNGCLASAVEQISSVISNQIPSTSIKANSSESSNSPSKKRRISQESEDSSIGTDSKRRRVRPEDHYESKDGPTNVDFELALKLQREEDNEAASLRLIEQLQNESEQKNEDNEAASLRLIEQLQNEDEQSDEEDVASDRSDSDSPGPRPLGGSDDVSVAANLQIAEHPRGIGPSPFSRHGSVRARSGITYLCRGAWVQVLLRNDEKAGRFAPTTAVVKDVLTDPDRGIVGAIVRLTDDQIGTVQKLI
eukprot:36496_1